MDHSEELKLLKYDLAEVVNEAVGISQALSMAALACDKDDVKTVEESVKYCVHCNVMMLLMLHDIGRRRGLDTISIIIESIRDYQKSHASNVRNNDGDELIAREGRLP